MGWSKLRPVEEERLWAGYRAGESCSAIARALGRSSQVVWGCVKRHGGFAPLPRKRAARALSLSEREEISRGVSAGQTLREIARGLGRAASSISREVKRHGGRTGYRALRAEHRAWQGARRPKVCCLVRHRRLGAVVARKLQQNWSPRQIAGWLPKAFAEDHSMRVSHETIYRSLFIQSRGALKQELLAHLRTQRRMRRARSATNKGQLRGQILDAVSIRERPAEVADRAVPGHWEGDLLAGAKNSHIATLVERHSRFVMLVKLPARDSHSVVKALSSKIRRLPEELRRSLTWDRGAELAQHKQFTVATDVQVYFCDPHSPWQRGSNENTNGLLRQYFPKGTDLSVHSQADLNKVALQLNQRPRETLDFDTPADILARSVALTA
jgi:IS30 family transposase